MAVCYVDGSAKSLSKKEFTLGMGMVLLDNESRVERFSCVSVDRSVSNLHEVYAFGAACEILTNLVEPKHVLFMVDDESIMRYTHEYGTDQDKVLRNLQTVENGYYYKYALPFLDHSRFFKVKSHQSNSVYNSRVDYLAKNQDSSVPYDEWLNAGFKAYDVNGEEFTWFAPFVGNNNNDNNMSR